MRRATRRSPRSLVLTAAPPSTSGSLQTPLPSPRRSSTLSTSSLPPSPLPLPLHSQPHLLPSLLLLFPPRFLRASSWVHPQVQMALHPPAPAPVGKLQKHTPLPRGHGWESCGRSRRPSPTWAGGCG